VTNPEPVDISVRVGCFEETSLSVAEAAGASGQPYYVGWTLGTSTLELLGPSTNDPTLTVDIDLSNYLAFTTDITGCGPRSITSYSDSGRSSTTFGTYYVKLTSNPSQRDLTTGVISTAF